MSDTGEKRAEIRMIAQLCGVESVRLDADGIFNIFRSCVSMGERGWLLAISLANIIMGGGEPIPDLVSVLPPGYSVYLKKVALVDNVVLTRYINDVIVKKAEIFNESDEDSQGRRIKISVTRYPNWFGLFVEYEHPIHGTNRDLWVFTVHPTGDYFLRSFRAPTKVADIVAEELSKSKTFSLEDRGEPVKLIEQTRALAKKYGGYEKLMEAMNKGEVSLPEGVSVSIKSEPKTERRHRIIEREEPDFTG
jgi:hypothetical protein